MGLKPSKKSGVNKFVLHDKRERFVPVAVDFEEEKGYAVAELTRSTAEDRFHNSFGLPSDVLVWLVGRYLELEDVGRLSRTCKTWRRVALQDVVWRTFANRMDLKLEDGADPHISVLQSFGKDVKADFSWLPPEQYTALCLFASLLLKILPLGLLGLFCCLLIAKMMKSGAGRVQWPCSSLTNICGKTTTGRGKTRSAGLFLFIWSWFSLK
jgi:hypothetical protein